MKTYLVGGAVRDRLLGREPAERDWVVVGATPTDLLKRGYRQVGRDFPVFLHPDTGEEYALARTERRTGPGHTDFVCRADPGVTLEEDLKRRDLTINAIAADGSDHVDPYGGRRDIEARLLRHVSPAFRDDPLRVFRVARFAAQLPGFTVCAETTALMADMVPDLAALPGERVWQEFAKAMAGPAPARFYEVLRTLDGADWFAGLDLENTVGLYRGRRFPDGEVALVALGWVTPPGVVEATYTRLRAPRLVRRASTLLAKHGRTLTRPSASAAAVVDGFGAIEAFRTGRIAGLVLDAAATCAGKPREALHALKGELRRIRVNAASGPEHGDALRAARISHVRLLRDR